MTDSLRSKTNVAIVFGRCRLFPHRRQLIVQDEIVSLGDNVDPEPAATHGLATAQVVPVPQKGSSTMSSMNL